MLMIRLSRVGKSKQGTFRLIINEKTKDTRGDYLENLGIYNPRSKEVNLKADRIKYWLGKGAKASDTVHNLLVSQKVIEASKKKVPVGKSKAKGGAEEKKPAAKA